jgi:two-component system sensor histidine kinase KdpD
MFSNQKTSIGQGRQYGLSLALVIVVALLCYPVAGLIGYRSVALLLLFALSLLSLRMSLYPTLAAATVSALVWNFFFIPPQFTFHIDSVEDGLMFVMYFIVALLNGVFTARIRRAEELVRQKEERANAAKLYDSIFHSLSHELRTPIASILGASDNLLADSHLSETIKQNLFAEIGSSAERLNRLVDNLLNMSRLDSGFLQPKLDWCDLGELFAAVTRGLGKELQSHRLLVEVPDDLPLFKLDFGLMEQVLTNILYNASLYTPPGGNIYVEGKLANGQCVIAIRDSGIGLSPADIPHVFDKFFRPKNAKSGGLGLGLSIAKGFTEAHGGTISVENAAAGGAVFTLRIPTQVLSVQMPNQDE